jgi:hypothetical protein
MPDWSTEWPARIIEAVAEDLPRESFGGSLLAVVFVEVVVQSAAASVDLTVAGAVQLRRIRRGQRGARRRDRWCCTGVRRGRPGRMALAEQIPSLPIG